MVEVGAQLAAQHAESNALVRGRRDDLEVIGRAAHHADTRNLFQLRTGAHEHDRVLAADEHFIDRNVVCGNIFRNRRHNFFRA